MRRVTADDIRRLDLSAARDYSIPGILLMENAGRAVSDVILRDYPSCKVLIFAGKGNNGGDGLVVARRLANLAYKVRVILLESPSNLKADSLLNYSIAEKMAIPITVSTVMSENAFLDLCFESDLIVDAIFGIGIHSPVQGVFRETISAINRSGKPVVSVDIPSGLDSDTGQVHGVAVKATSTVTLALPKRGLFEGEGPSCAGRVEVADIGIPRDLLVPYLD
jgi:NAD(P)H-hydrate epimerase